MDRTNGVRPTVLVVEDDHVVASAMRLLFDRYGWSAQVATSLDDARRRLDPPPQWIVLDLNLPDGSGVELLREMRQHGLDASHTVVITGVIDPKHLEAVKAFAPAAVLHKPSSFRSILSAMGIAPHTVG